MTTKTYESLSQRSKEIVRIFEELYGVRRQREMPASSQRSPQPSRQDAGSIEEAVR